MKITLIGTTAYEAKMLEIKSELETRGNDVRIPAFDSHPELDEIGVCDYNLEAIKWADVVGIVWDQRSSGTIFDFGMCYALRKPIKIFYLQPKTFANLMKKYESME